MKTFQCLLFVGAALVVSSTLVAYLPNQRTNNHAFVLYNKHNTSIFYSVGQSEDDTLLNDLQEVSPKRWAVCKAINTDKPVYVNIALAEKPKDGDVVDQYIFTPGSYDSIALEVKDDTDTQDESAVVRDGYTLRVGKTRTIRTRIAVKDTSAQYENMRVKQVRYTAEKEVMGSLRKKQLSDMNVDELEREVVKVKAVLKGKNRDVKHDARLAELNYVRRILAARYVQLTQ